MFDYVRQSRVFQRQVTVKQRNWFVPYYHYQRLAAVAVMFTGRKELRMSRAIYDPDIDAGLDPGTIEARLRQDGWDPVLISDEAGYVYPPHSHAATKLLAITDGSIDVTVAGTTYQCRTGDRIVIAGNMEHSAIVGPDGCTFYWSEQLR
jgi:AraC-like ligand binding domain